MINLRPSSKHLKWIFVAGLSLIFNGLWAQQVESDERALINVEDGVSFKKDESFLLNLRFRMQNRFGFRTISESNLAPEEFVANVRRLRLRLDGFVMSPKFQYYIQLSFSREDQDLESRSIAQTIRDAILYYTINDNLYVGFGQSKLPGNRQRVVSSGNQQFVERSIVNARFNIDRDFGFFAYYTLRPGDMEVRLKSAITSGDGRNALAIDDGLAYTARMEWLPLGSFENSGDFSEGDLEFESTPKLSLAASWSFNHKATRTGGQTGSDIPESRDLYTFIADGIFKYQGFALSSEYLRRQCDNPTFLMSDGTPFNTYVPSGYGVNTQVSYTLRDYSEFSMRMAYIRPDEQIAALEPDRNEYLIGYTKYFNGHRIKLQGNIGYNWFSSTLPPDSSLSNQWVCFFQVEFGI